jgi:hypothetical protein
MVGVRHAELFTGQSSHFGFERVQTIAPRSIIAWLKRSTPLAGVTASLISHRRFSTSFSPASRDGIAAGEHALHVAVEDREMLA